MELAPSFAFRPLSNPTELIKPPTPVANPLGPLAPLLGTWHGKGFNTIWRPNHTPGQDRFLELNVTDETIQFEEISGEIPNRGLLQPDISMFGLTYLQQIKDANLGAGLHIEPGIWATVPKTTDPAEGATVVRMASIPHGTTILVQGSVISVNGPPQIKPTDIFPFPIGNPGAPIKTFPEQQLGTPSNFRSPPNQLVGVTQAMVNDPNSVLAAAIAGQTIKHTTVLVVSSRPAPPVVGGGTANTAFLAGANDGPNADAALVSAIFWIETVKGPPGKPDFLQLQYTQTVMLNFNKLSWPHVTVATLRKKLPAKPPYPWDKKLLDDLAERPSLGE